MSQAANQWVYSVIESQGLVDTTRKSTIPSLFRSKRSTRPVSDKQSNEPCGELSTVKAVEQERSWSAYGDEVEKNVYGRTKVDEGPESVSFTDEPASDGYQFNNVFRYELGNTQ